MWLPTYSDEPITNAELLLLLASQAKGQITVLEGPSGCGKTRLLRAYTTQTSESSIILAEDQFQDILLARITHRHNTKPRFLEKEIIVIEDIDLLSSSSTLQIEAASLLRRVAASRSVIVTGIEVQKRLDRFFQSLDRNGLDYHIYSYAEDQPKLSVPPLNPISSQ